MKIKDVILSPIGAVAQFNCVVSEKTRMSKKNNGGDFFVLELQDNTGKISMPVWNIDGLEWIEVGTLLTVWGKRNEYNKVPRMDMTKIEKAASIPVNELTPAYDIPQKMFSYFDEVVLKIKDPRYLSMLEYILGLKISDRVEIESPARWEKYIAAPCAVKHHGNKVGGLFVHTVGVMKNIENIICNYVEEPFFMEATEKHINADRLRFLAIMHDYNKTNEYLWGLQISYNEEMKVGHDALLVGTLAEANGMLGGLFSTKEMSEMFAIVLMHHGQWGQFQPKQWEKPMVEAKLLHAADLIDSQIIGEIEAI